MFYRGASIALFLGLVHIGDAVSPNTREGVVITPSGDPVHTIVRTEAKTGVERASQLIQQETHLGNFKWCLQKYVLQRTKAEGFNGAKKLLGLSLEDTQNTWEELREMTKTMCKDSKKGAAAAPAAAAPAAAAPSTAAAATPAAAAPATAAKATPATAAEEAAAPKKVPAAVPAEEAEAAAKGTLLQMESDAPTEEEDLSNDACKKADAALDLHIKGQPPGAVSPGMYQAAIQVYCKSMSRQMDVGAKALFAGGALLAPQAVAGAKRSMTSRRRTKAQDFQNCLEHHGHDDVKGLALHDMDVAAKQLKQMSDKYCETKALQLLETESNDDPDNNDPMVQTAIDAGASCHRAQQVLAAHLQQQEGGDEDISEEQAQKAIKVFCRAAAEEVEGTTDALLKEEADVTTPDNGTNVTTPTTTKAPDGWGAVIQSMCFPSDATALVLREGAAIPVALRDLATGDLVAVGDANTHKSWFTPLLGDLHSSSEQKQENLPYLKITHQAGTMHVSSQHLVATGDGGFVPASELVVGSSLLFSHQGILEPSVILDIAAVYKTGMFSPITWSGTVIVDGVLASNYAVVPAEYIDPAVFSRFVAYIGGWTNLHHLSHVTMLPVRIANARVLAGFAALLPVQFLRGWFIPDSANTKANKVEFAVPRYVDVLSRTVGSVVSTLF